MTRPALRDYLIPAVADVVADTVDLILVLGRIPGAPPAVTGRAQALEIKLVALARGFYANAPDTEEPS